MKKLLTTAAVSLALIGGISAAQADAFHGHGSVSQAQSTNGGEKDLIAALACCPAAEQICGHRPKVGVAMELF